MSTPTIQDDHAAQLAEEAAAAVRAAMEDRNRLPGTANPANGGFVQTDSIFPPATERSKIIRIKGSSIPQLSFSVTPAAKPLFLVLRTSTP